MENKINKIRSIISSSIDVKQDLLKQEKILKTIDQLTGEMIKAFRQKNKVLLCGNGGSAADAQHIAAELSGRFYFDREPLFAEAVHVNSSYLTAVANDYSFDDVFSRYIRGIGKPGDFLVGISTSGNSNNVIRALEVANNMGMITVGLTGQTGGKMKHVCKYLINVPSSDTARVQEAHIMIGHIICEMVEDNLFGKKS
ncbi:MAG: SIS domain-containing protein [Candidatus Hodarchaeota archaeon]